MCIRDRPRPGNRFVSFVCVYARCPLPSGNEPKRCSGPFPFSLSLCAREAFPFPLRSKVKSKWTLCEIQCELKVNSKWKQCEIKVNPQWNQIEFNVKCESEWTQCEIDYTKRYTHTWSGTHFLRRHKWSIWKSDPRPTMLSVCSWIIFSYTSTIQTMVALRKLS